MITLINYPIANNWHVICSIAIETGDFGFKHKNSYGFLLIGLDKEVLVD